MIGIRVTAIGVGLEEAMMESLVGWLERWVVQGHNAFIIDDLGSPGILVTVLLRLPFSRLTWTWLLCRLCAYIP